MASCSSQPDPKEVVFKFINAVYESDSLKVSQILDLDSYIQNRMAEMSPEDSVSVLKEHRTKTMESLLGDGETRTRWMDRQIIVNRTNVRGDIAEVDVSFIDKASGHMLYTRIQLQKQPDKSWRVIWFQ